MAVTVTPGTHLYPGYVTVGKRDSNGYFQGQVSDPDSPGTDVTSSAMKLENITAFDTGAPTLPTINITGGQQTLGKVRLPASELSTPTFQLSEFDEAFHALFVGNYTNDVSYNTARVIRPLNMYQETFIDTFVRFHIRRTHRTSTAFVQYWDIYTYLNCTIKQVSGPAVTEQSGNATNPANIGYELILSSSTRDITGELLSGMTLGAQDDKDVALVHRSLLPLQTTVYNADGIAVIFTLGFRPSTTDATGAIGNNYTLNGVQASVTSVVIATGVVTISAAGSSADIAIVDGTSEWTAI